MAYIGNSPGVASQRLVTDITATDGQTAFYPSAGYTLGYVDVYQNGILLVEGTDYTAADGVVVTLLEAAALNDSIKLVTYTPRGLTDGYTKAEADARFMDIDEETLPSQAGQSGNYLTTDGANASWGAISQTATGISYDNSVSGLSADNLQAAVDYLSTTTRTRQSFIATSGQSTFTVAQAYVPGVIDVFLNGVLLDTSDYTAANGTSVTLSTGAAANDILTIVYYNAFDVANALPLSGGTLSGRLTTSAADGIELSSETTLKPLNTTNAAYLIGFKATGDNSQIVLQNSVTGTDLSNGLRFGHNGSEAQIYNYHNSDLRIALNAIEKYRFGTDGVLELQNGGGIKFGLSNNPRNGATAYSSHDVLNDYEVGTYAPKLVERNTGYTNIAGGYGSQQGRYVKVGGVCHVAIQLQTNGTLSYSNGGNDIGITLPFDARNEGGIQQGGLTIPNYIQGFPTLGSGEMLMGFIDSNDAELHFRRTNINSGNGNITCNQISNSIQFYANVTYLCDPS